MDQTEQQYIDALFDRLQSAERQGGPRDAGAEGYIRERISRQPGAPYYMAQAIIVQEEALKAAQQRIAELEYEIEQRPAQAASASGGGGFLGGLFGGGPARTTSVPASGSVPRAGGGFNYPRGQQPQQQADSPVANYGQTGRGGGFLAGAMQTAVGVAGGVVLGNMIADMIGGDKGGAAQAGEAAKPEAAGEAAKSEPAQEASNTPDQNQQDDPFANVEETQYDDDDSFIGGDFGGDFDI
jgi:hypothetical protein